MKVVETFTAPQGEGQNTGINTTFVRLYGCNLACTFCDEPKHKDASLIQELTLAEIANLAEVERTKWVCITGGEPTLQTDLPDLIDALHTKGLKVQVETNGYDLSRCIFADLITISPKEDLIPDEVWWSELKLIIPAQEHLLPEADKCTKPVYLQPENYEHKVNYANVEKCMELLTIYPQMGISIQLHKVIGCD